MREWKRVFDSAWVYTELRGGNYNFGDISLWKNVFSDNKWQLHALNSDEDTWVKLISVLPYEDVNAAMAELSKDL